MYPFNISIQYIYFVFNCTHVFSFFVVRPLIRVRNQKLIFLFFNQNIGCGYSKEPSQWDGSFENPKQMFKLMDKKIFTILCPIFCLPGPKLVHIGHLMIFLISWRFSRLLRFLRLHKNISCACSFEPSHCDATFKNQNQCFHREI